MIIQFNWYELTQTTKLAESQVILMFCLYINRHKPLVKRISSSHVMLRKKLNIGNNYYGLLHSKLIVDSKNGIFSNFYCKEPQNYLTNCSFLHSKVPAQKKADYMYILGQRSLNNFNNWIPDNYVEPEHWGNPFIKHENSKIIFTLEKQL